MFILKKGSLEHIQALKPTMHHYLEPAERVLLAEVHGLVVVAVVALPSAPVGLQLVPLG